MFKRIMALWCQDKLCSFPCRQTDNGFELMETREVDHYISENFPTGQIVSIGQKFTDGFADYFAWAAIPGYILAEQIKTPDNS